MQEVIDLIYYQTLLVHEYPSKADSRVLIRKVTGKYKSLASPNAPTQETTLLTKFQQKFYDANRLAKKEKKIKNVEPAENDDFYPTLYTRSCLTPM